MLAIIDNYDSFTYNLYQYLGEMEKDIQVFRNDKITPEELEALDPDQIVISPGPKTPDQAGNCLAIIDHFHDKVPILGICLGHQAIGQYFGGKIVHAPSLFHGKSSEIIHTGKGLFSGLATPLQVARYHSLVIAPESLPEMLKVTASTQDGVIMAVAHRQYPVYGLQFHPESINTPEGKTILRNFLSQGGGD